MMALITSASLVLWHNSQIDMTIASNTHKIKHAQFAAQSGLNHFVAMYGSSQITTLGNALPNTRLSSKTSYKVDVYQLLEGGKMLVVSTGMYLKRGKVVFEYPIRFVWENPVK